MLDPSISARAPHHRDEVVVLAGGDAVDVALKAHVPPSATVIAADSGLAAASVLELTVDLVVGDLDSVDPDQLAAARAAGIPIDQHPTDKDRTDLAIALDAARALAPERITVVGGDGGRLDHLLSNVALLASNTYDGVRIVARMGTATVTVVRPGRASELSGRRDELVSLLPMHGPARGVTTTGLRFSLDDDDLESGSSRGVSNEFTGAHASVSLRDGVLLAVQPGGSTDSRSTSQR